MRLHEQFILALLSTAASFAALMWVCSITTPVDQSSPSIGNYLVGNGRFTVLLDYSDDCRHFRASYTLSFKVMHDGTRTPPIPASVDEVRALAPIVLDDYRDLAGNIGGEIHRLHARESDIIKALSAYPNAVTFDDWTAWPLNAGSVLFSLAAAASFGWLALTVDRIRRVGRAIIASEPLRCKKCSYPKVQQAACCPECGNSYAS